MGYVPYRGSVVSHVKPPNIMLLYKKEFVKLRPYYVDNARRDVDC